MFKGLKALFAGLIAGTAVGILFSPKKGEDFRKTLKKEIDDGGTGIDTVKDTFMKMGTDIKKTANKVKKEIEKKRK